jgi:hypothetical protein
MQRSKQTALMFLLGAVLVGGVLGFSADRVMTSKGKHWSSRMRMYQDLALSEVQQATLDSVLDERNCQLGAVMKPVAPQLDSIRKAAHQQLVQILTPAQRARLEERMAEQQRRDSLAKVRRDSIRAQNKTTTTCT